MKSQLSESQEAGPHQKHCVTHDQILHLEWIRGEEQKASGPKENVVVQVKYDSGLDQGVDIDRGRAVERWIDSMDIQEENLNDGLDEDCQGWLLACSAG